MCWIIFQRITKVQLPVDIIEMIIIFSKGIYQDERFV